MLILPPTSRIFNLLCSDCTLLGPTVRPFQVASTLGGPSFGHQQSAWMINQAFQGPVWLEKIGNNRPTLPASIRIQVCFLALAPHNERLTFFTHTERIKLTLLQASLLGIHFLGNFNGWTLFNETILRRQTKNAWHLAGFEPTTSWCWGMFSTAALQQLTWLVLY